MTHTHTSIDELLAKMVEHDASDLHLAVGSPPMMRVHGQLERLPESESLTSEETRTLVYGILSTEQQKQLETKRQLDFSYSMPGPRALPRQRLLPARERRRGVPPDPRPDPHARRAADARAALRPVREAARPRARDRPDRLRQVDHARGAHRPDQPRPLGAHPHDRGPDRVPALAPALHRQPARDRLRRHDLRRGAARGAAPGPRRDPRRRDARPRDDLDRADRRRDRPPRLRDAAHPERAADDRPRHRRVPVRAAAAGARPARLDAPGRRDAEPRSRRPTAAAGSPRSRSSCPTTPSGT